MPIPFANILQPIIDPLESVMVFIHDHIVGGSWGLAIVGLTIVARLILLPLAVKQVKSMQELQKLAPQMKALREKYKDDKQRQQQELMKLYQDHGVNPFASCLPLVAQFPIFIGLFYMLRKDLKLDICGHALRAAQHLHHDPSLNHFLGTSQGVCDKVAHGSAKFLFIPDITDKAHGGVLIALIALYVGSQVVSSLIMPVTDRNQRILMLFLPLIFTVVIINFPAGLLVYWITTNLWTIGQQIFIRRFIGPVTPPAALAGAGAGDGSANGGGGGLGLGRLLRGPTPDDGARDGKGDEKGDGKRAGAREPTSGGAAPPRRGRVATAPPPPPRKKKKRSGRRR